MHIYMCVYIYMQLRVHEELQHPLNAGFATPTQSTDLSFLSQMRQKLLLSQDNGGVLGF